MCGHPGAVAILAIDDEDNVLLVRQYRHPAEQVLLEIPAGTLDVDPKTGAIEDPAKAARRELEEETGYRADSWQLLTTSGPRPASRPSRCTSTSPRTCGRPTRQSDRRGPDEDERLKMTAIPWRVAVAMAEAGEIHDAKSLVGLLWLARLRERIEPPAPSSLRSRSNRPSRSR